jgi:hypothetical protein
MDLDPDQPTQPSRRPTPKPKGSDNSSLDTPVLLAEYLGDKASLEQELESIKRQLRGMYSSELVLSFCVAGVIILALNENRRVTRLASEVADVIADS